MRSGFNRGAIEILRSSGLGGFGGLNQFGESGFVINGDFGKHFTVQGDTGFSKTFDKTAVADFVGLAGVVVARPGRLWLLAWLILLKN